MCAAPTIQRSLMEPSHDDPADAAARPPQQRGLRLSGLRSFQCGLHHRECLGGSHAVRRAAAHRARPGESRDPGRGARERMGTVRGGLGHRDRGRDRGARRSLLLRLGEHSLSAPRSAIDEFGAFTAGMLLFVPADIVAVSSMDTRGSLAAGLTFLAVVAAVAGLLARTQVRWVGIGLLTGFALMTLVTGGLCTLFGGKDDYPVGGLLYVAICAVLLAVAVT